MGEQENTKLLLNHIVTAYADSIKQAQGKFTHREIGFALIKFLPVFLEGFINCAKSDPEAHKLISQEFEKALNKLGGCDERI